MDSCAPALAGTSVLVGSKPLRIVTGWASGKTATFSAIDDARCIACAHNCAARASSDSAFVFSNSRPLLAVSVNREAKTFRIHDSERGTKRIKVTGNTQFERVNGFAGLHAGQRRIEVTAKRKNGRWVASLVERSGGGGHHGGGGGGDDD